MTKKLACFVLALTLLTAGVVYATPSRGVTDMTQVTLQSASGVPLSPDFVIEVKDETSYSANVLGQLNAFLAGGTQPIAEYFPANVVSDLASALITGGFSGVSVGDLEVNEFMPLDVVNYDPAYGDVKAKLELPTQYKLGQAVVAVVGIKSDADLDNDPSTDDTEWSVAPTRVTITGAVEVTFTEAVLEKHTPGNGVLAILSEPVA